MSAGGMLLSPVWYTGDKALFHGLDFSNIYVCRSFIFLGCSPISKHNNYFLEIQYFQFRRGDFDIFLRCPSSSLFLFCYLASWNKLRSLSGFVDLYFTQSLGVYQRIQPLTLSVNMYIAFPSLCTSLSYLHMGSRKREGENALLIPGPPFWAESECHQWGREKQCIVLGGLITRNSNTYLKVIVLNMF